MYYYTVGYISSESKRVYSFKNLFTKNADAIDFLEDTVFDIIKEKYNINLDFDLFDLERNFQIDEDNYIIIVPNFKGDSNYYIDIYLQTYKRTIYDLFTKKHEVIYPIYNFFINKHEISSMEKTVCNIIVNQFKE